MEERTVISQEEARSRIKSYKKGRFFTVTFVKRSNGEVRTMNCRKGVKKGVNGNGLKFDPNAHDLVPVWDRPKKSYRSITLDEIHSFSMDGEKYIVV